MGVQYNPGIVTDGLVLSVDAADKTSYPGSGTTWTDIVGSSNGTITKAVFDRGNVGSAEN